MLIVAFGQIVFAGNVLRAQDGVDIVQGRDLGILLDLPNVDLDFARVGKLHLLSRAEDASLVDCSNGHR